MQPDLFETTILTDYAVEARYPGLLEDVIEEDYLRAIDLANQVFSWAEAIVLAASLDETHDSPAQAETICWESGRQITKHDD